MFTPQNLLGISGALLCAASVGAFFAHKWKKGPTFCALACGALLILFVLAPIVGDAHVLYRHVTVPSLFFHADFSFMFDHLAFFWITLVLLSALTAAASAVNLTPSNEGDCATLAPVRWIFYPPAVLALIGLCAAQDALTFLCAFNVFALCGVCVLIAPISLREQPARIPWRFLIQMQGAMLCFCGAFLLCARACPDADYSFAQLLAAYKGASVMCQQMVFLLFVLGAMLAGALLPFSRMLTTLCDRSAHAVSILVACAGMTIPFYLLMRFMPAFVHEPSFFHGVLLILIGLVSAFFCACKTLMSQRLKIMLGYSSVQNSGVSLCALGLMLCCASVGDVVDTLLCLCGVLLLSFNHTAIKAMLFVADESAERVSNTGALACGGGLLRHGHGMAFGIGAVSMTALPPMPTFAAVLLIFLSAFNVLISPTSGIALQLCAACTVVGVCASYAVMLGACVKMFGFYFLGAPATDYSGRLMIPPRSLYLTLKIVLYGFVVFALFAPLCCYLFPPVMADVTRLDAGYIGAILTEQAFMPLLLTSSLFALLSALSLVYRFVARFRGERAKRHLVPTWNGACGEQNSVAAQNERRFAAPVGEIASVIPVPGARWMLHHGLGRVRLRSKIRRFLRGNAKRSVQYDVLWLLLALLGLLTLGRLL